MPPIIWYQVAINFDIPDVTTITNEIRWMGWVNSTWTDWLVSSMHIWAHSIIMHYVTCTHKDTYPKFAGFFVFSLKP